MQCSDSSQGSCYPGINLSRWALNRADHNEGRRNVLQKTLDAVGLGFDS